MSGETGRLQQTSHGPRRRTVPAVSCLCDFSHHFSFNRSELNLFFSFLVSVFYHAAVYVALVKTKIKQHNNSNIQFFYFWHFCSTKKRLIPNLSYLYFLLLIFWLLISNQNIAHALTKPPAPIIFIHGIASNAETWGDGDNDQGLRKFLTDNGWTYGGSPVFDPVSGIVVGVGGSADFYTMNFSDYDAPFPSQNLTLERQGLEVSLVIQRVLSKNPGRDKVILVGHSMGGLAARSYLQNFGAENGVSAPYRDNVLQLITIGTPHQGSTRALLCDDAFVSAVYCPMRFIKLKNISEAVELLKPGSLALEKLNDINNPNHRLPPDIFYTSFIGITEGEANGDGVVSTVSQNLTNIGNIRNLMHQSKEIVILSCNGLIRTIISEKTEEAFINETHTCQTSDKGFWAELLKQLLSPKLVTTSDLSILPKGFFPSYAVGQTISAQFSITNKGAAPVTVAKLTVGGRDPNNEVTNFPEKTCITLEPNVAYKYVGDLTLTKAGTYRFFPAYETSTTTPMCPLPDGNWNTAIPAVSGITQYTLNSPRNTSVENDTTPPNVSISSPVNGATVNGTFSVTAEATDNLGVSRVEFYFDNKLLGSDSSFPYSWPWNTTLYSNGSHTLDAKAYDGAGNQKTSSSITVTVNNTAVDTMPPTISSVIASTTSTTATVTWTTNEMATTQVEYGPTTSYGFSTPLLTVLSTGHAAVISNLQTNTLYHYRVKSRDAAGNLAVSGDNTFFTSSAGNVAPSVTVGIPNGGENWQAGSVQTITWTTKTGISSVSLFYSTDSGLNWTAIPGATGIANKGSFQWTIPNAASSTVRVAITAIDGGMTGSDMSDGNFIISASCTAPSTPQLWGIGTLSETGNYTVNWSAVAGASTYTLEEATNSAFTGAIEYPPASGTSKSISGKTTNVYYYRVKANNSCSGSSSSGWSNTEFIPVTINQPPSVPSNPSPAHTVTSVPRRPALSWTASDPEGPVDFALFFGADPGNLSAIRGFDSGGAASSYNFPFDLDPGKTYYWYIKARDNKGLITTGPIWQFTTEYSFADLAPTGLTVTGTIAPNAQVTLNLTVRNQGTFTAPGAEVSFYLSSTSTGKDQKISNCCHVVSELAPGTQKTVSATVTLTNLKAGQSYLVAHLSTEGHFIDGNLGNNILGQAINYQDGNSPVISSLVLQFGIFRTGGKSTIAFTVSDDIGVTTLDFYYSYDNGANWNTIATGFVPGSNGMSGGYDWTIPTNAPLTNQLKIKMVAWDTSGNRSEAIAGPYTIISGVAPTVTLLSPNGGEVWDLGSTQAIRWSLNAPNGIGRMTLYLYWSDQAEFIADVRSNTSGSFVWTVPNSSSFVTSTASVKIRVEDLNGNESEDWSDAYFSIRDASAPPPPPWAMPQVITGQPPDSTVGHSIPRIAADRNDNVHMIYSSGEKLYYKKKIGSNWSAESLVYDPNLLNRTVNSYEVTADSNGNPHVVWSEQPTGPAFTNSNLSDVFHTYYNGSSWSAPMNISSTSPPSDFTWSSKNNMPQAKRNAASGVVNGKIYVFGGDHRVSNYEYDPAANSWTQKADVAGNGIDEGGAAVINNKIYAVGDPFDSVVKIYDPAANTWTTGATILTPRRLMGVAAVNGKLYTFGGGDGSLTPYSTVEEYDPVSNRWTPKNDMPTARYSPSVAVVGNLIYVIGGYNGNNSATFLDAVEIYDPASNTWSVGTPMPTRRRGAVAPAINGKIYVVGGVNQRGYLNVVEEYNPTTGIWFTKAPMLTSRADAVSGTVDNRLYVIGGTNDQPGFSMPLSTVEEGTLTGSGGDQTVSSLQKITTDTLNNLHVVWQDGRSWNSDRTINGQANIYYRKRDNTGNWSSISQVTTGGAGIPAITSDANRNLHLVYTTDPRSIAYMKWDGTGWSSPIIVTDQSDGLPSVISDHNHNLHLSWYRFDSSLGIQQVFYSFYNGTFWTSPEEVSDRISGQSPVKPSILADSLGRPHVIWETIGDKAGIYHKVRDMQGWSQRTQLNLNSQFPQTHSSDTAITSTDHMHVVWTSSFNAHGEVFYNHAKVSLDRSVPTISLLSPSHGEALSIGVFYPISWLATDNVTVSSISLKYTTDNGTTFTTISDGLPNTGTYSWTVPNITSSTVEIFATAFDAGGNQATATSGLFNISDQTPPAVSVQSPNGGEFFEAGSVQTIRWSATDNVAVSSVDLSFSADGGSSWISIVSGGANTGAFEWTIPHFISANNLVRVVASDAGGRIATDTSNAAFTIVSANAPPLAPYGPLPPNGEANVSTQSALSWNGGDPDTGDRVIYTIYFGTNNNPSVVSTSQPTAVYNTGPLTAMTTYYWKVVASDGKASATGSLWSFTTGPEPVMAPANLKATAPSANRVDLSWSDAASNETGYTVERKMGLNGSYAGIATLAANAMTYSDIGLNGASTYIYRVRAFNTSTASAYSNEAAATTANTPPNLPSAPSPADHAGGQPVNLTLAWSGEDPDPSDTLTYDVYFGTNSDPPLVSTGQSLTNYTPEPLSHQKFYYWRVVATDNHGHSSSGPVWSFVTQAEPAPNTPVGLSGTATPPKEISLRWTDSSNNEIGFKLERKTGPNGAYDQIAVVPANTRNYTDSNLVSDKTYSYRIRAYNGSGNSGYSNEASVYLSPAGLRGEYFNNADLSTPGFTRVDPEINFEWAERSPDPSMEPDTFSVRWSGKIRIDHDETYTFSTLTDEGVRLWIDGHLVIDHWQTGAASNNGTMALTTGLHDIKVEFFEESGEAFVQLFWSSPSTPNAIIPQDHLLPPEPVGSAPTLSWTGEAGYTADGIDPQAGNTTAAFTYRIKYTDADGDAPMSGYPRVHILKGGSEINGSPFAMTGAGGSPAEGTIYTYSATLPEGTDYTYYFDAKDAAGLQAVAAPAAPTPTAPLDAPDVGDAPPLQGDLDGSGRVDGFDLGSLGLSFGSRPVDPNWNPGVDLNGDGVVDGSDLTLLGVNFGKTR